MDDRLALYADADNSERARAIRDSAGNLAAGGPVDENRLQRGLSVVILNLDHPELVVPLVEKLLAQREAFRAAGLAFEVAIGDTGSSDPEVLAAYERWRGDVTVVGDLRYHFSRCNNQVARRAAGCDAVLFLNSDVVLPDDETVLLTLFRTLDESPSVGILGAVLHFPDGTIQHLGVDFFRQPPLRGFPFHARAHEEVAAAELPRAFVAPAVTGSFLLMRRSLFDRVGGFSEEYLVEAQDIDLCLRAHRAGYVTRVENPGLIVHLENATRPKGEESWPDRRLFMRRWRSYVEAHFL